MEGVDNLESKRTLYRNQSETEVMCEKQRDRGIKFFTGILYSGVFVRIAVHLSIRPAGGYYFFYRIFHYENSND